MLRLRKLAAFGLLWLALSAVGYSAPVLVNFDITDYPYPILVGGQFLGSINGGSNIAVFCNDWQNDLTGTGFVYQAYVSDATDITKTRFGNIASSGFEYPPNPPGTPVLTALDRYTLAAWLTTQYTYPSTPTADDEAIQTALWVLLSQTGVAPPILPNQALVDTWLSNAVSFKNNDAAGFAAVQSAMRIITSTDSVDLHSGQQELIFLTPEPSTYVLIGGGLIALAFSRRRRA